MILAVSHECTDPTRMKVGLVLGAGGIQGGAWLTGGFDALAEETGWDPADADYVVGTSAGSMIGALCASGVPPWFMVAHSRGETFDGVRRRARDARPPTADRAAGAGFELERDLAADRPRLLAACAPHSRQPAPLHAGDCRSAAGCPAGSSRPSRSRRRSAASSPAAGARIRTSGSSPATTRPAAASPFGRAGAPRADLADAVAASCAIPGIYHPVTIGGRRYVDGGIYSASNLDLLRDEGFDLVICLNPTSTLHPIRAINPRDAVTIFFRRASGHRLGSEAKKMRAIGAEVVLIQPTGDDLEAMGPNLMSTREPKPGHRGCASHGRRQLREPGNRDCSPDFHRAIRAGSAAPTGPPSEWPDWRDQLRRPSVAV